MKKLVQALTKLIYYTPLTTEIAGLSAHLLA